MESSDNKTNLPDRRVSARNSLRVSIQGEEDIDLVAMGAISDGFRPMQPVLSAPTSSSSSPAASTTSGTAPTMSSTGSEATSSQTPASKRPSSIAKPPRPQHDSFSLRHDGGMGPIQEGGLSRTVSVSTDSTAPFIRNEGPYQGPSGPSHPYQMYPQNVRTRTMSVATSSTVPVSESSYNGPQGPTHPYGMYPQGTSLEANATMAGAIPVGFNGVGNQYQRRLGPEGEEIADMIGPDGHTEQLPPYTRYPEETYARKVENVEREGEVAGASTAAIGITSIATTGPSVSRQAIPGAGGIGLATRNPEFESTDNLGSPQSRHSMRSFPASTGESHHEINTAAMATSEKDQSLKPWQLWMKRRVWGIVPYWAIFLTLGVLALMAIILGSVVGTLLSRQHKKPPGPKAESDSTVTATITYDATPITTPTDLPPLATGTFGLPLMSNRVSSTCINDTQQSQAWSCNIINANMYLTIDKNTDFSTPGDYSVSINCNQSMTLANNVYTYGEQPPLILNPLSLELVNDTLEPTRGPAWFRMMPYNKTMIIPESVLSPSTFTSGNQKRGSNTNSFGMGNPSEFKRKGLAQTGDKPWICTWPDTFLELFIYPVQNSSWNRPPMMPSSGSPTTMTSSTATETLTSSFGKNGVITLSTPTTTTSSPFPTAKSGDSNNGPPPQPGGLLPPYPRVLKLEERRLDGSPEVTCVQVELKEPGRPAVPVKDKDGNPVAITIAEIGPRVSGTVMAEAAPDGEEKRSLHSRDNGPDLSQCGCMWFLT